jgi:hypothetical protein
MPRANCGVAVAGLSDSDALVQYGPTLFATVSQPGQAGVGSKSKVVPFLIDSGASHSCIDYELARDLDLPVIDRIPMCGITGSQDHDVVLCQITIPDVSHVMTGRFACVHLTAGGQAHQALFGRDFLKHVVMIYDGEQAKVTVLK